MIGLFTPRRRRHPAESPRPEIAAIDPSRNEVPEGYRGRPMRGRLIPRRRRRPREIFGPLHRFGHPPHRFNPLAVIADADSRMHENLHRLEHENLADQLGAVVALLEDIRNTLTQLTRLAEGSTIS